MPSYPVHTLDSAPPASKATLETLQKSFGMIPNLAATMAASPTLINGFVAALVNFMGGTFTGAERQTLLLTNAVTNRSAWAVAFHSTAALREGVDPADVAAVRAGRPPADLRLAALSTLTRRAIESRGQLTEYDLAAFTGAGFTEPQVFEVLAGVAISAMANYAGNIAKPALDAPFKPQEWSASASSS